MLFRHPVHPGRAVRLGYCLNVHPAETLAGVIEGMRAITLPLRERLASTSSFGVGMYFPAVIADELHRDLDARASLRQFLVEHALDPFTYNAFPYGGFHSRGLKQAVFDPPWSDSARNAYTVRVAELAAELCDWTASDRHLSISTHTGGHQSTFTGADRADLIQACERELADACRDLLRVGEQEGRRIVLALEPEPRANCNDYAALAEWRRRLRDAGALSLPLSKNFGTCLDTCHAAVEFEPADHAFGCAVEGGAPLGKIQFTSALALHSPGLNARARERFMDLDEPRFLHQVTGRGPFELVRAGDIPEVRRAWDARDERWLETDEWRCHFHVPVDLGATGIEGITTTREYAGQVLMKAVKHPDLWGTQELHVEIETYTWSVLPREARGTGELVDGLEREYRHVIGLLRGAGWMSA